MRVPRLVRRMMSLGLLATLGLLPGSAPSVGAADATPAIANGTLVSLEYTLKLDDASVVESNVGKAPLIYTHGSQQLVPGLEKALIGLHVGDTKQVTVAPAEAYGEQDPQAVEEVDKALIPAEAQQVGTRLQGQGPDGRMLFPRVAEVKDSTVVLDFNHPLAGKTLHFDIKVVDIKPEPPAPAALPVPAAPPAPK